MNNREETWQSLDRPWDLLVVGGGITGAGILREATRIGLRTLLVEQRDFAWGTSSRSSKLVHGGLRYLKEGKLGLMRDSVSEREQLKKEGPGLIDPLGFLLTIYRDEFPGRWGFELALTVYDLLALQWEHRYYDAQDFRMLAPHLTPDDLRGGFRYGDAQTDDARLVLRVLQESVEDGGVALNYAAAESLLRDESGQVSGVRLRDVLTGRQQDLAARAVINATGAWADQLRQQVGGAKRIRPLRGSHLVFPSWRLPVAQGVSFFHPLDQRPVFIFPWEGVTVIGTTDVDHDRGLQEEPGISPQEVAYLMAAVESRFPSVGITLDDVISTFAGVRPVIGTGKADPSQESRDHVVWQEKGLLTVTGGKLTTFHIIAQDALRGLRFPEVSEKLRSDVPVLKPVDIQLPDSLSIPEKTRRRLLGRYGSQAPALVSAAKPGELELIQGTPYLWAELRWACQEHVIHLEDLLLRRLRLGLLLPAGGEAVLPEVRRICQPELGWDDAHWEAEQLAYRQLWQRCYSMPDRSLIPDWKAQLVARRQALALQAQIQQAGDQARTRRLGSVLGAAALAAAVLSIYWLKRHRKP